MIDQQQLFKQRLPRKPRCGDFKDQIYIRTVAHAIKRRYIQPNHLNSRAWLMFDIDLDEPDEIDAFTNRAGVGPEYVIDDRLLPPPTFIIQNKANGHAHVLYGLETEVHTNSDSRPGPLRFAAAVDVAFAKALDADASYAGLISKNPLHEHWRTWSIGGQYDLSDLADFVDLRAAGDRRRHLEPIGLGRNCRLFDQTRRWAYRWVDEYRETASQTIWGRKVLSVAESYNADFPAPLGAAEARHVAKSVAKWTWTRYQGRHYKNRGVMQIDPQLELVEKQRRAANRSSGLKAAATEAKVRWAIETLTHAGKRLTAAAVARESGIARETISRRYRHLLP